MAGAAANIELRVLASPISAVRLECSNAFMPSDHLPKRQNLVLNFAGLQARILLD